MAESQVELDRALARTRPDEHAAQIVHRILCIRCRMDWHCGGLSEDDFGEAGRIADLLAERDVRVAAEAQAEGYRSGYADCAHEADEQWSLRLRGALAAERERIAKAIEVELPKWRGTLTGDGFRKAAVIARGGDR